MISIHKFLFFFSFLVSHLGSVVYYICTCTYILAVSSFHNNFFFCKFFLFDKIRSSKVKVVSLYNPFLVTNISRGCRIDDYNNGDSNDYQIPSPIQVKSIKIIKERVEKFIKTRRKKEKNKKTFKYRRAMDFIVEHVRQLLFLLYSSS